MKTKYCKRLIAAILSVCIMITALPAAAIVTAEGQDSIAAREDGNNTEQELHIVKEIEEKRKENVKEFLMSDGTTIGAVYNEPVHYESDGSWVEIDNTLIDDGNGALINRKGNFSVRFAKNSSSGYICKMNFNGFEFEWGLAGTRNTNIKTEESAEIENSFAVENLASTVIYENLFDGVDVEYEIRGNRVKENIIIKRKLPMYDCQFELKADGITLALQSDGSIIAYETAAGAASQPVLTLPAPYMYDADGNISENVQYELTQEDDGWLISVTANDEWINAEGRAFPVTIDPAVTVDTTDTVDDFYYNGTTVNSTSDLLYVGATNYAYTRLNNIPHLDGNISKVEMYTGVWRFLPSQTIDIKMVTSDWNYTSIQSTLPTVGNTVYAQITTDTAIQDNGVYADITDIVKRWQYGTANNGIQLSSSSTTTIILTSSRYNYSQALPYIVVTYTDNHGVEDKWTTHSQDIGRAGTAYVDNYTGYLTIERDDLDFGGVRMPAETKFWYGRQQVRRNQSLDMGWKSSYFSLFGYDDGVSDELLRYEDADGTVHYFIYDAAAEEYIDEDGLGADIAGDATLITINNGTTTSTYSRYYRKTESSLPLIGLCLSKIENNASGDTITISGNENFVTQVIDGVGRKYVYVYDSANKLIRINYYGTGTTILSYVGYSYDSCGNLTQVTYPDGETVSYSYYTETAGRENWLKTATDVNGRTILVKYADGDYPRVQSLAEYTSQTTALRETASARGDGFTVGYSFDAESLKLKVKFTNIKNSSDFEEILFDNSGEQVYNETVDESDEEESGIETTVTTSANDAGDTVTTTVSAWTDEDGNTVTETVVETDYANGNYASTVTTVTRDSSNTVISSETTSSSYSESTATNAAGDTVTTAVDANTDEDGVTETTTTVSTDYANGDTSEIISTVIRNAQNNIISTETTSSSEATAENGDTTVTYTDADGITTVSVTDKYGNILSEVTSFGGYNITTTYTYTADKNYLAGVTDSLGNSVVYVYDTELGTLESVTDANGVSTSYTYNAVGQLEGVSSGSSTVTYDYVGDRPVRMYAGSGMDYRITYDAWGNISTFKTQYGTQLLNIADYIYDSNRNLTKISAGNGGNLIYTYNADGNMTSLSFEGDTTPRFTFEYDADGQPSKTTDVINGFVIKYDENGNLEIYDSTETNKYYSTSTVGDETSELIYNTTYTTTHITNDAGDKITSFALNSTTTITKTISYDEFDRVEKETLTKTVDGTTTTLYEHNYSYAGGANNATSERITSDGVYGYTYDANGNILTVSEGNVLKAKYTYDNAGQLIREDIAGVGSYVYEYTVNGNITSAKTYEYTVGTLGAVLSAKSYTYSDYSQDVVTSFNGNAVSYDYIGNITAFNGMSFDWEGGRQVQSITVGGTEYSYTYNEDGLRRSKEVNGGNATYYFWNGTQISAQMINGAKMYFRYDEAGRPFSVSYGSLSYYYILNQQGDVVGLRGTDGATAVNYKYDAWGNIISITDANGNAVTSGIGITNPLRYRGYFYDTETKLYYLQSRYYSPELRRFICGDIGIEILEATMGEVLGTNMFVYCNNNPVINMDSTGKLSYNIYSKSSEAYYLKVGNEKYRYYIINYGTYSGSRTSKKYRINNKEYTYNNFINYYNNLLRKNITSNNTYLSKDKQKINAQYIFNYFYYNQGWTRNAICGMLGNMYQESRFNPGLWQGKHSGNLNAGFGLTQWTPATKLINWANENGYDYHEMDTQLKRISYEVKNSCQWVCKSKYEGMTFSKYTKSTKSVTYLSDVFTDCYEIPKTPNYSIRRSAAYECNRSVCIIQ